MTVSYYILSKFVFHSIIMTYHGHQCHALRKKRCFLREICVKGMGYMIQIALCDDDRVHIGEVEALLHEYFEEYPDITIKIKSFSRGPHLLEYIRTHDVFDLYLLDIIMPQENGIDLGRKIRGIDKGGTIFYLTSSIDFAVDAFPVKVSRYLLKPIEKACFFQALDAWVEEWLGNYKKFFTIKTRFGIQRITVRNLVYGELIGHCIHYHLSDGTELEGMSLRTSFRDAIGALLDEPRFTMTSASFVVNLHFIENISAEGIKLTNGKHLPVSRTLRNEIVNKWLDFHLKGE